MPHCVREGSSMSYPDYSYTNRERVGKAIDLLKAGLEPFVWREFAKYYDHKVPCSLSAWG